MKNYNNRNVLRTLSREHIDEILGKKSYAYESLPIEDKIKLFVKASDSFKRDEALLRTAKDIVLHLKEENKTLKKELSLSKEKIVQTTEEL